MLTLKYCKTGSACFISHIDLLRHTSRVLRRAGIRVNYSQGFNPHALVFFSAPLGVGVASEAEYLSIDTDMEADDVFARYNSAVPDTLKASAAFVCSKNPNLQGKTVCADYVLDIPYTRLDLSGGFTVSYQRKGQTVAEDVSDRIYSVFDEGGKLGMRLALGNTNLRPDRIIPRLREFTGADICVTDVCKLRQYVDLDGRLTDVDDYLKINF